MKETVREREKTKETERKKKEGERERERERAIPLITFHCSALSVSKRARFLFVKFFVSSAFRLAAVPSFPEAGQLYTSLETAEIDEQGENVGRNPFFTHCNGFSPRAPDFHSLLSDESLSVARLPSHSLTHSRALFPCFPCPRSSITLVSYPMHRGGVRPGQGGASGSSSRGEGRSLGKND